MEYSILTKAQCGNVTQEHVGGSNPKPGGKTVFGTACLLRHLLGQMLQASSRTESGFVFY